MKNDITSGVTGASCSKRTPGRGVTQPTAVPAVMRVPRSQHGPQPHDPHCQALTQADPCYSQWITASVKDALSSAGVGAFFNVMNFGQMLLWHVVLIRSR